MRDVLVVVPCPLFVAGLLVVGCGLCVSCCCVLCVLRYSVFVVCVFVFLFDVYCSVLVVRRLVVVSAYVLLIICFWLLVGSSYLFLVARCFWFACLDCCVCWFLCVVAW